MKIRWLWTFLSVFLMMACLSALIFDRVDPQRVPEKRHWGIPGMNIPLADGRDFYVWAVPVVGGASLGCMMLLWLAVRRRVPPGTPLALRLPAFGPMGDDDDEGQLQPLVHQDPLDGILRSLVTLAVAGLGSVTSVHLFRQLLRQPLYDATTQAVAAEPGLVGHFYLWEPGRGLRYASAEGIGYYGSLQTSVYLLIVVLGLVFGLLWLVELWRVSGFQAPFLTTNGTDLEDPPAPSAEPVTASWRKPEGMEKMG